MEERIKRIKVTKDSLLMYATFERTDEKVKDFEFIEESFEVGLLKKETVQRKELYYINADGEREPVWRKLAETSHKNIYDVYVVGNGRGKQVYLTPIQISPDGKITSVSKITFHNIENGKEVTHRLYFPAGDQEMYERNTDLLADLERGDKDTIWIEYTV